MIETIVGFYTRSTTQIGERSAGANTANDLRKRKWSVFLSITFGYGFYYVCRLSFSVAKKTMADEGIFDVSQMGIIGSALFFAYAIGKLTNGVIADRVNVRRFMATGLFLSAIINLFLGFSSNFIFFLILWGMNGWFQSIGAPSSVVSISHWFSDRERGTFYGMWSTSHNIGEAITFIAIAVVVTSFSWRAGFHVAGALGLAMSFFIWRFLYERPETYGLPAVVHEQSAESAQHNKSLSAKQWDVAKNPAVWILAFSSAFFYITRYAVSSWGVFFLEAEKGYTTLEASSIISVSAILGIFGTFFSGMLSDKFFHGRRNIPALIFGAIYVVSIAWFVLGPANSLSDSLSMGLFGFSLGVLLVYLGGLMAVDICSKDVSGTALGIIGVASYIGAALQDIVSGYLIESEKLLVNGVTVYNFDAAGKLWIGSACISLVLSALVWNPKAEE